MLILSLRSKGAIATSIGLLMSSVAFGASHFMAFDSNRSANGKAFDSVAQTRPFTIVYDVWHLSCNDVSCFNVPSKTDFQKVLNTYATQFRSSKYIALDFENIVVTQAKSDAQAQNEVKLLKTFASWVKDKYPSAKVGLYDYDYNSSRANLRAGLYQADGFDFFAPTMYQRWATAADWQTNLTRAVQNDRAINPNLPIYAFVSPYKAGVTSKGYLGDHDWSTELMQAAQRTDGIIVWTMSSLTDTLDLTSNWVKVLQGHMSKSEPSNDQANTNN